MKFRLAFLIWFQTLRLYFHAGQHQNTSDLPISIKLRMAAAELHAGVALAAALRVHQRGRLLLRTVRSPSKTKHVQKSNVGPPNQRVKLLSADIRSY